MSNTFKSFVGENQTISLDETPQRIAVLGYPDYDTVKALGLESAIVAAPKSHTPAYIGTIPEQVIDTEDLHKPDLDALEQSQPDLIIATGRCRGMIDELQEIAPVFLYETTSEYYWQNFREINFELGKILNKTEEVARLINDIDQAAQKIQSYNETHEGEETLTLMLSNGEYRDFSESSRFAFIYQYLHFGVSGKHETISRHGDVITAERVNELDPKRIFVIRRDEAVSEDSGLGDRHRDELATTQAAENGRIFNLTADLWYIGGGGLESTQLQIAEIVDSL